MIKNKELVQEYIDKYSSEALSKYKKESVYQSIAKVNGLSDEQFEESEAILRKMMICLSCAYELNDYTCDMAMQAVELHKQWLKFFYDGYSKEYHLGLANMYVEDERFRKNYDVIGENGTEFFKDAIYYYHNH